MIDTDAAYLAGLVDGDGYIGIYHRKDEQIKKGEWLYFVRIIGTTTPALRALAAEFDCFATRRNPAFEKRKEIWTIQWQQRKAAKVAEHIRPYLRIKAEQAGILLEFAATYSNWCHMKPLPDDVREHRVYLADRLRAVNASYGRPNHHLTSLGTLDT